MSTPLLVEIIAYAPTGFYHCTHCEVAWREFGMSNQIHDEQVKTSLPEDLAGQFQIVSDWVRKLFREHPDLIEVKVIDAASFEGFVKSLRHRARRYPAVILDHKLISMDGKLDDAELAISQALELNQEESVSA